MNSIEQILQDAAQLSPDERLALAHRLLTLDEVRLPAEVGHAWDLEIRERIARYDRGETTARPVEEVLVDLNRKLRK